MNSFVSIVIKPKITQMELVKVMIFENCILTKNANI